MLALRLCDARNGVSRLHGAVTRQQWGGLWPELPSDEVPISHVTNGVHLQSWITPEIDRILDRQLGEEWRKVPGEPESWASMLDADDVELWHASCVARARLVDATRARRLSLIGRRRSDAVAIDEAQQLLDPDAFTIGFVGRFVAYKRPTLFLRDPDRLARLLSDPDRPVQIVFAGKAHPNDEHGKRLLRTVTDFAQQRGFTRPARVHRGLRPHRGPRARPGRGPVAEHAAAAARGVRHRRHEGRSQRRAQPEHPRRLVGRGRGTTRCPAPRRSAGASARPTPSRTTTLQDELDAESLYDQLEHDIVPLLLRPRRRTASPRAGSPRSASRWPRSPRRGDRTGWSSSTWTTTTSRTRSEPRRLQTNGATRARRLAATLERVASVVAEGARRGRRPVTLVDGVDDGRPARDARRPELAGRRTSTCGSCREDAPRYPVAAHFLVGPVGHGCDGRRIERSARVEEGSDALAARVLPVVDDAPSRFLPGLIAWSR